MSATIIVLSDGAMAHLKKEGKNNNKEFSKLIGKVAGYGEGFMKNHVPILCRFLKNSTHSKVTGINTAEIYSSVAYAVRRNYENERNPDRKNYIEKTEKFINKIYMDVAKGYHVFIPKAPKQKVINICHRKKK